MTQPLRAIPSVEKLWQELAPVDLPRPVVIAAIRKTLQALRESGTVPGEASLRAQITLDLDRIRRGRLQPVINGTGVVIHTNLGRAPLPARAGRLVAQAATGYTNLEFDLETGARGARGGYLEELLALLSRAEAATLVNNCAAALMLILRQTTRTRPEVIISRGELVQIGGGFRIPDILEAAGATLKEVGTTNRTTAEDYAAALSPRTGLILKVHQSNFRMTGFVASASRAALAALARQSSVPLAEDLGSGAILATETIPDLPHEPTPAEVLEGGVDLVCFSGDKLFGGPQAGIVAGRKALIQELKANPFYRAVRCDKLTLAALQATAELYLEAESEPIPALELLRCPVENLRVRAQQIIEQIAQQIQQIQQGIPLLGGAQAALQSAQAAASITLGEGTSQAGGGTMPESGIPTALLQIRPGQTTVEQLAAALRRGTPPVIGLIQDGQLKIDLRTVFPEQDTILAQALARALGSTLDKVPSP